MVLDMSCLNIRKNYVVLLLVFFFFKQKTAYEMRISDWSSDMCSSDLNGIARGRRGGVARHAVLRDREGQEIRLFHRGSPWRRQDRDTGENQRRRRAGGADRDGRRPLLPAGLFRRRLGRDPARPWRHRLGCGSRVAAQELAGRRSAEHTSELQSRMRITYAVFYLKHKRTENHQTKLK